MQCTVIGRGEVITFASPYTDSEAVIVLRGHVARHRILSSFADDLLRQAEDGKQLNRRQLDWVHRLVLDSEEREHSRIPREISGNTRVAGSHRSVIGDHPPMPRDEEVEEPE